jgi:hypothetical protein
MTRISLFDELKKGGYESCLITTYNIHFPFYEDVLLRRMQSAGIDHHLVLVDNTMCIQAINTHSPVKAGFHYSLAPMKSKAAFHPKILLLLGKNKGLLAVGSHNLTLSGFGTNLEVTNVIKFNKKDNTDSLSIFQSAMKACSTWIGDYGNELPEGIKDSFVKITESCAWLRDEISDVNSYASFYYSSYSTPSLWTQVSHKVPDNLVSILGVSAFFDNSLSFVKALSNLNPDNFKIGIQNGTVKAPKELTSLNQIKIVDSSSLLEKDGSSYIHAKLIYSESATEQLLITGSANLSAPAWLASGDHANAEAVVALHNQLAIEAKNSLGLDELNKATEINIISDDPVRESDSESDSVSFIVADYKEGESLNITWNLNTSDIEIGYLNIFNKLSTISHKLQDGCLLISEDHIKNGEIIHIMSNHELVAYVMVHNNNQIREYSSSGKERRLRLALGSLNTSSPDVDVIFDLIGGLMLNDDDAGIKPKVVIPKGRPAVNKEERNTLISTLGDRRINAESGRYSLHCGDDISLIINALISGLNTGRSANSSGLNEDLLGRNEEEQIGQDDSQDVENISFSNLEVDKHIRLKINSMLKRLNLYLQENGVESCHAALGVLILIHGLLDIRKESVEKCQLYKLLEIIANNLLNDKDPILLDEFDNSVHSSDEWTKLMGYVVWLASQLDITLHSKPSLSEIKANVDKINWENAIFFYLAQHLVVDEYAMKLTDRLIIDSGDDKMNQWLVYLKFIGKSPESVSDNKTFDISLASSPKLVFPGFRIVSIMDSKVIKLSTVKALGEYSAFGVGYLDLRGC